MTGGYVTVPRLDRDLLGDENRTTESHRGAWLWLYDQAAWKDRVDRFGRFTVRLRRGEIACSCRFLATAWNWSHGRVQRWLKLLADRGKITLRVENGITVIALGGYASRAESNPESTKPKQSAVEMVVDKREPSPRESQENRAEIKNTRGDLGRSAPSGAPHSEHDKAYVAERVAEATAQLTGRAPTAPVIGDPAAYGSAIKKARRDRWLTNLGGWVGNFFTGAARLEAWQVLDEAQKAGSRAATPEPVRKMVDRISDLYREAKRNGRIERAATNDRLREWSFAYSARKDRV